MQPSYNPLTFGHHARSVVLRSMLLCCSQRYPSNMELKFALSQRWQLAGERDIVAANQTTLELADIHVNEDYVISYDFFAFKGIGYTLSFTDEEKYVMAKLIL
jgi:hypothetical protein